MKTFILNLKVKCVIFMSLVAPNGTAIIFFKKVSGKLPHIPLDGQTVVFSFLFLFIFFCDNDNYDNYMIKKLMSGLFIVAST